MRRREFIGVLGGMFAICVPSARAQQEQRIYRIGYLSAPTREAVQRTLDVFLRKLRDLGWIEGKNLAIEYRWAEGHVARLPELADELVRLNVDLIVAPSTSAALAAKHATSQIPIVMVFPEDPVELGLVGSLSHPDSNVTGTTFTTGPGFNGKVLEFLKQVIPGAASFGVLGHPDDPSFVSKMQELQAAAAALNIRLQTIAASGADQLEKAFATIAEQKSDAVVVATASAFLPDRKKLAELALKRRLPTIAVLREFAEAGGLMSYGVNMPDFVGRAATYVDKILKGAQPANLAVEQPTKFELVINLKTAKALGLNIP